MRTMMSGAAAFTAAVALSLLSSAASARQGGGMCVHDTSPPPNSLPPSGQLFDQMEGKYQLSNGQRVTLHRVHQRLWIDFGRRRDVPLDRVGETQFASRDGSVRLSYQPEQEVISMRYSADARGRLVRAC